MSTIHHPPHPGELLREDVLPELGLNVTQAAQQLGVTRAALSRVLNGRAGISIDMAIRLSKAFGSTPETWLAMQMAYDLWRARGRMDEIKNFPDEPPNHFKWLTDSFGDKR